jgi:hypothetical protein
MKQNPMIEMSPSRTYGSATERRPTGMGSNRSQARVAPLGRRNG